jgi:hypothetical protein
MSGMLLSVDETMLLLNLNRGQVQRLCNSGRLAGAVLHKGRFMIPETADPRLAGAMQKLEGLHAKPIAEQEKPSAKTTPEQDKAAFRKHQRNGAVIKIINRKEPRAAANDAADTTKSRKHKKRRSAENDSRTSDEESAAAQAAARG